MDYKTAKRLLDKGASYFWQNRDGRYALVNVVTLKTALGIMHRLDAIKLTDSLNQEGYRIAPLAEEG